MLEFDMLIVGGGIAGASLGYQIASQSNHRVAIAEMESQPGYHTTGRSAAFYAESYGGDGIRPLTIASKDFLYHPPNGFSDTPLILKRGALHIIRKGQEAFAAKELAAMQALLPAIYKIDRQELADRHPHMTGDDIVGAIVDEDCGDLDVAAIHQGFLKGFKAHGGTVLTQAEIKSAIRQNHGWQLESSVGRINCAVIVNCAGAWADEIANRVGAAPQKLEAKRRTVITVPADDDYDSSLPLTVSVIEDVYYKPESGGYLISPCDETVMPACDAQPDDLDVAIAADRFEKLSGLTVRKIQSKWAGLRTFARDKKPVIGFDPHIDGFFWSVGQGGYGIQTCDAWSRVACALLLGHDLPHDVVQAGGTAADFAPKG